MRAFILIVAALAVFAPGLALPPRKPKNRRKTKAR